MGLLVESPTAGVGLRAEEDGSVGGALGTEADDATMIDSNNLQESDDDAARCGCLNKVCRVLIICESRQCSVRCQAASPVPLLVRTWMQYTSDPSFPHLILLKSKIKTPDFALFASFSAVYVVMRQTSTSRLT